MPKFNSTADTAAVCFHVPKMLCGSTASAVADAVRQLDSVGEGSNRPAHAAHRNRAREGRACCLPGGSGKCGTWCRASVAVGTCAHA